MHSSESSEAAERAVLGSMLLDQFAITEVSEIVNSEDFFQPYHQVVFEAITAVHGRGEVVDYLSVHDEISRRTDIGATYREVAPLTRLTQAVATTANAAYYAEIVRNSSIWRRVSVLGMKMTQEAMPDARHHDVREYLEIVAGDLEAIAQDRPPADLHGDPIDEALRMMDEPIRLRTRWRELDKAIGGWMPGDLYVIGARPSVGKTVFGCNAALDVANRGYAVEFFSLEMPAYQIATRMMCDIAEVDLNRVLHRALRDDDTSKMRGAAERLRELPISIVDRTSMTLPQIRSHVRAAKRKEPLGLVVIDHLTLVRGHSEISRRDRREQIDLIAQGSKEMGRELDVSVLALAQVNRGPEHRSDRRPTLADLRESGGIEMAADTVILMHRDPDPNTVLSLTVNMIVAKSRHGGAVAFDLDLQGQYARLTERPPIGWVNREAGRPMVVPVAAPTGVPS